MAKLTFWLISYRTLPIDALSIYFLIDLYPVCLISTNCLTKIEQIFSIIGWRGTLLAPIHCIKTIQISYDVSVIGPSSGCNLSQVDAVYSSKESSSSANNDGPARSAINQSSAKYHLPRHAPHWFCMLDICWAALRSCARHGCVLRRFSTLASQITCKYEVQVVFLFGL